MKASALQVMRLAAVALGVMLFDKSDGSDGTAATKVKRKTPIWLAVVAARAPSIIKYLYEFEAFIFCAAAFVGRMRDRHTLYCTRRNQP